jgi:hypothetical protein
MYPLNPRVDDVCVDDIAHALAMQTRFTGHCRRFYSVAQHSVHVSHVCDRRDALWGLLHDASEAYLSDVSRPVKRLPEMSEYRSAEQRLLAVICERFGLPEAEPPSVKRADTSAAARILVSARRKGRTLIERARGLFDAA